MQATILVVEDGDAVRRLVCTMLIQCGYRVLEAGDGEEALEIFEKHRGRIDLVISDVIMPRMGGGEMAARLLRSDPHIPILFMSGFTDSCMNSDREPRTGDFIPKPFTSVALHRKVRQILDGGNSDTSA